jgi:hypothetical protein
VVLFFLAVAVGKKKLGGRNRLIRKTFLACLGKPILDTY